MAGGDAEGLAALQVSLREGMDFLRDGLGQDAYSETEFRIDLATRLDLQLAFVELEEPRPLDYVSLGEFAETAEVLFRWLREDRDVLHLVIQLILPTDHAVPEPVRGDGELDGHERPFRPVEETREDRECLDRLHGVGGHLERDGMEDVLDHFGPDEPSEEVVDHGPLVVPSDDPATFVEPSLRRDAREGRRVDDLVVVLDHAESKLRDDQVLVIAGVAEEGPPPHVPREVVFLRPVVADQQVDAVFIIEKGLVVRPSSVHGIEIESGGAEVDQSVRVVVPLQLRRRVEGEVMVHELAEIREARGDGRIVARGVLVPRRLGLDHLTCEFLEVLVVGKEGR